MDALELVTRTSTPINGAGAAYYFDGAMLAAGESLGLDAFHFYCTGRGGVLGDVERAVVASAFGYEQAPVASDADQAALMAADVRTDKLLAAWFEVLDKRPAHRLRRRRRCDRHSTRHVSGRAISPSGAG